MFGVCCLLLVVMVGVVLVCSSSVGLLFCGFGVLLFDVWCVLCVVLLF